MKLSCLVAKIDGSWLTVRVVNDTVIVNVREVHEYFEDDVGWPMIEVYDKVYVQEFDLSGIPWRPPVNEELVAGLLRKRIKYQAFKKFAEPITRLSQRIANGATNIKKSAA